MTGVPIIELGRVHHVGSLDPARWGSLHRSSQEGPCLSVSLCPDAWTGIARLGGCDPHTLGRDGGIFPKALPGSAPIVLPRSSFDEDEALQ
ncbi:hypothetical protein [Methylobacterium radiotolerans]|uniref:hypothetical protein n=1 Tax=Methylobacterium radiotolerans TaxID=31998 RepID=UPI0038D173ED